MSLLGVVTAYIGPGAGLGLLGALIAVGGAVAAALFFVVMWPLRMLLRRAKGGTRPPVAERTPAA